MKRTNSLQLTNSCGIRFAFCFIEKYSVNNLLSGRGCKRDDAESDRLVNDDNLVGYPFVVQSVPFVGYDIGPFVVTVPFVVVTFRSTLCSAK